MVGPSFFTVRQTVATVQAPQDIVDPAPFNNLSITDRQPDGRERQPGGRQRRRRRHLLDPHDQRRRHRRRRIRALCGRIARP